ncbi:efflux RND transporter permease subunit [bacterium]|nr:efflux RND transporter permease subunit [bacterium]
MSIAKFSVKQPVLTNMIIILVLIAGLYFYFTMGRELLPLISVDKIVISTVYPGATSEEIEKLITQPIEEEISGIDGIDDIISVSYEGMSTIVIDVLDGFDIYRVEQDIKSEVDKIRSLLPDDAEDPYIKEIKVEFPVCTVTVSGEVSEKTLRTYAKRAKDQLKNISGVGTINLVGYRDREIWVELDREKLIQNNLPISSVISAIRRKNLNLPGGRLKTREGEFLIRTLGEISTDRDIAEIVLKSSNGISNLFVGDVANIRNDFEERNSLSKVNGNFAINLDIEKRKNGDTIGMVVATRKIIKKLQESFPPSIKLNVINDRSIHIKDRIDLMQTNGLSGLILVLISLCLLLNFQMAFWTAIGIPFAFLGTFILMKTLGISINMLSLFGMIVVLGMIVDDAIVICENFFRYLEMGYSPKDAAIIGTEEVMWPVIAAVSTTIAAFAPLFFLPGVMGKFMSNIPVIIVLALCCSLVEALFILPSHLADFVRPLKVEKCGSRKTRWYDKYFDFYEITMVKVLKMRYLVIVLLLVAAVIAGFTASRMKFVLFGKVDMGIFMVNMEAFSDSSLEDTEKQVRTVEKFIADNIDKKYIKTVTTRIGMYMLSHSMERGDNKASVIVELDIEEMNGKTDTLKIINDLKTKSKKINGFIYFNILLARGGPPVGDAISYRFKGEDIKVLKLLARRAMEYLKTLPGVVELSDDFPEGKSEIVVELDEEKAKSLGVDVLTVAQTLRACVAGEVASSIRTGDEEIKIRVIFDEKWRNEKKDVLNMPIITQSGKHILLNDIAGIKIVKGIQKLSRHNQESTITVTGDIIRSKNTSMKVMKGLKKKIPEIFSGYPDYRAEFGGEADDTKESMKGLLYALCFAGLVIYMILGTQFQSFIHPITIMATVPFGFIGVIFGFFVSGQSLGLLSLIGVVALSGIVVNDSLVLLDFVLRLKEKEKDMEIKEVVAKAGRIRIRPIILTSITTIFGLLPMCLATTGQAAFLAPMAQSLAWGLTFSTILTLIVIPCVYLVMEDIKRVSRKILRLK